MNWNPGGPPIAQRGEVRSPLENAALAIRLWHELVTGMWYDPPKKDVQRLGRQLYEMVAGRIAVHDRLLVDSAFGLDLPTVQDPRTWESLNDHAQTMWCSVAEDFLLETDE